MSLQNLQNNITLPLSDFMFVVRKLWLDESSSNNFTEAQDKIKILLNFLDLGREATIIDFAQYDLNEEMQKLTEHKIHVENGRQNGVKTFREKKAFNHSELTRLYMIHSLVQNFNDNNHIQMAEYEKKIARLKAENEQLQLIVRLHKVKADKSEDEDTKYHTADTDPDDDWHDNELADMLAVDDEKGARKQKSIYVVKPKSSYVGVASTQNPYCITIAC